MIPRLTTLLAATALSCLAVPAFAGPARADATQTERGGWSDANRATFRSVLAQRDRHGLDRVAFLSPVADSGDAASVTKAYNKAALDYAAALAHGLSDPSSLHEVYTVARPTSDPETELATALRDGTLEQWLNGLAPDDAEYRSLSDAYRAAVRATATGAPTIPVTKSIHAGDTDPRVAAIARQLADDGYLAQVPGDAEAGSYSPAIADAVKSLQRDYGIRRDGIVGPNTLAVINLRPGDRARALAVALERRRWLSRTPPATRIDVNTAAAELRYYRDGQLVDRRKVIVGEPGRETPPLGSPIYRLVANPTWTVPKSIDVSSATVRAKHMRRVNGYWVQPSGPDNALGLVKFDMQNNQAIYLHDTSSPELFDRSQRHLSHGCIRVADALGFARMLADQEGVGEAWQKAHESGSYEIVDLPRQIPVRLLYQNAFVADDGAVSVRTDPYGWNDAVAVKLGFDAAETGKAKAEAIDIGP
ncbi:L,D-transpeptidase family protein [Sphingomonas sp.]|uniref:L,D-transpeptidase family protein n=1 Tax=Sphingomonas sp. TaxID=28214 RepID=UPI0035C81FE8